jgi:hypothetical protein
MKTPFLAILILTLLSTSGIAQSSSPTVFDSEEILDITLKGNVRDLLNNRTGEAKNFPILVKYHGKDGTADSLPITMKTRGHFRRIRSNCEYPPLLLQFTKGSIAANSRFFGESKLKLIMPCKGEEFVIHEWMVYKLYNLLTPLSYKAALVRVTLADDARKKNTAPFYGVLLEQDKQMARRNNLVLIKRKMRPQQTVTEAFLRVATFEYLIGNTDWSVEFNQNISLLATDSLAVPIPVPHDFDLAGIVGSPYALPAEELQMTSVQERRYRGYCIKDIKAFDNTVAFFNEKKKDIYALYSGSSLLDPKYVKTTLKYLDDFYATINNPKKLKEEFEYPCDPNGTGNVILKGLKEE